MNNRVAGLASHPTRLWVVLNLGCVGVCGRHWKRFRLRLRLDQARRCFLAHEQDRMARGANQRVGDATQYGSCDTRQGMGTQHDDVCIYLVGRVDDGLLHSLPEFNASLDIDPD
jgi:hypothetical protein